MTTGPVHVPGRMSGGDNPGVAVGVGVGIAAAIEALASSNRIDFFIVVFLWDANSGEYRREFSEGETVQRTP